MRSWGRSWGSVIKLGSSFLICVAMISRAPSAMACSVCYGDPNSPMTKGVEAGVLVLLAFVGGVLLLLASLLLFWMRRAANLEELSRGVGDASAAWAAESRGNS